MMGKFNTTGNDEKVIWKAFCQGSQVAFYHFYESYFKSMFGYGKKFTQDDALIKDAIQEIFVELWESRAKLTEVHSPKFYLLKCLRNRVIKELAGKHASLIDKGIPDNYSFEADISHEMRIIQAQLDTEMKEKLLEAFDKLPKRQKEAIYLRFFEKMDYDEISNIMLIQDIKYARTLVYRALAELKSILTLQKA